MNLIYLPDQFQFIAHPKYRPSSSASTSTSCFYLAKNDVLKENKSKASTSGSGTAPLTATPAAPTKSTSSTPAYSKIDRHRVIHSKLESQQVPSKRSKVLSSVKTLKSDDTTKSTSLVGLLIATDSPQGSKTHLKVPLSLHRRNSFNGIARKDLLAQPSTSMAAIASPGTSLATDAQVAHCSTQSSFTVASTMKSKSNLSSFRRRKSKRLTETRTTSVVCGKGPGLKAKTVAALQKKRSV